mgnify:CR=1 FL=1
MKTESFKSVIDELTKILPTPHSDHASFLIILIIQFLFPLYSTLTTLAFSSCRSLNWPYRVKAWRFRPSEDCVFSVSCALPGGGGGLDLVKIIIIKIKNKKAKWGISFARGGGVLTERCSPLPLLTIIPTFVSRWSDAVLQKRLDWAFFVLLLSTLVC